MKIIVQTLPEPEKEAELYVIGQCLALEIDGVTTRVALTVEQWSLLERAAKERAS